MECVCSECSEPIDPQQLCPCGGLPEFTPARPAIDALGFKRLLRDRRASFDPQFRSGVWRYAEVLPPVSRECIVTLNEGNVPLYESDRGAAYAGVDRLAYLHLGMNPTGSFKDLGMTVAISAAKAAGYRGVACASTGNTASSMAAYAARGGMTAHALVPRGRVARAKLAQMLDYGAEIIEVDGSFDTALASLNQHAGDDVAVVNSINPYRIEGQKIAAYAILEQRSWTVPDWIVLPGGNLGNTSAIGKAFREALSLGLIDRLPRLAVAQASGASPFVRVVATDRDLEPVDASTKASAIAIGAPKSWRKALREVRASDGVAVAVDDDDIFLAKAAIGAEGIGCEPASAAALAGLHALRRTEVVAPESDAVAILTGHTLKSAADAA